MSLLIKFVVSFATIGLLVSLTAGFLGGNRLFSTLVTALVCALLSGALGVVSYKVLEMRVPEFLETFQLQGSMAMAGAEGDYASESSGGGEAGDFSDFESPDESGMADADGQFGDHILVDNIKIKNEPKLMAEAIRTMLAKDEMEGDE